MTRTIVVAVFAVAACGPETSSFRTTDRGDPDRPTAAQHVVPNVAVGDVWSNGGYIGSSDEPMTHVGFELRNTSSRPIVFDADALRLSLFDKYGAALPPARFSAITPLGPARIAVGAGTTKAFDAYFVLPVRPRVVGTMRVQWSILANDRLYDLTSNFVRDDDEAVTEPPVSAPPSS